MTVRRPGNLKHGPQGAGRASAYVARRYVQDERARGLEADLCNWPGLYAAAPEIGVLIEQQRQVILGAAAQDGSKSTPGRSDPPRWIH